MRASFLLVFFTCVLCATAWAQPRTYPLAWYGNEGRNARTQVTTPPYTTTLKLPYFYDFSSRYLHIDYITNGTTVIVHTLRPHGLKTGDSTYVSGASASTIPTGKKYIQRTSDYEFQLFNDKAFSDPTSTTTTIDYLRITKVGAIETVIPDTLAFIYNKGGVQINGGSAKNQPSYYVARFDGLNEDGIPYNTTNEFAIGETDSLTSQAFDLSSYTVGSKLYMSYYYQHGGYGEQPDVNDHLYLDFLDNTMHWNVVKDLTGATGDVDSFYIALVPINETKYLHNAFKYRFRSYGRQSGAYDVWNLDYIYINKNRTDADSLFRDFAMRDGDQSFLQFDYTAMPFNHFFTGTNDATTYFNKTLKTTVTHQGNLGKPKTIDIIIKDQNQGSVSSFTSGSDNTAFRTREYTNTINAVSFPTRNAPIYIDLSYGLSDGLRTDAKVPTTADSIETMFNNVLTKRTYLYDYYAYDDSEAESGFGINEPITLAMEFACKHKDTLTHVDICFTRNKQASLENFQIFLMVWGNDLATELYKEPISVHYPTTPNGFVRYKLNTPLLVDSAFKFHIGYQKNFPELLTVGYDRNRDSRDKSSYLSGGIWYQMDASIADVDMPGTMMMRPVFYKVSNNVPVGVQDPNQGVQKNVLLLYPNPATTSIDIVSTEELSDLSYTMYSLIGQTVASGIITSSDHTIDVSQLSTGMYLILCTDAKGKMYSTRFLKE